MDPHIDAHRLLKYGNMKTLQQVLTDESSELAQQIQLAEAAQHGWVNAVDALIAKNARVPFALALQASVERGHEPVVELLLERFANQPEVLSAQSLTVIPMAAARGHTGILRRLLAVCQGSPDVPIRRALHAAAQKGQPEVIALLLTFHGQHCNAGEALILAARFERADDVAMLAERCDVIALYQNARQQRQWNILEQLAGYVGREEWVVTLKLAKKERQTELPRTRRLAQEAELQDATVLPNGGKPSPPKQRL